MALQALFVFLALYLLPSVHGELHNQLPSFCQEIGSLVALLDAGRVADPFCSSLLHIVPTTDTAITSVTAAPSTSTVTVTATAYTTSVNEQNTVVTATMTTTTTNTATVTCQPTTAYSAGGRKRDYQQKSTTSKTTNCQSKTSTSSSTTHFLYFDNLLDFNAQLSNSNTVMPLTSTVTLPVTANLATVTAASTSTTVTTSSATSTTKSTVTVTASIITTALFSNDGTYSTPDGYVFDEHPGTDFPGYDIHGCACFPGSDDCLISGVDIGSCQSYDDCQNACITFNSITGGENCVGISYTPQGTGQGTQPFCFPKYAAPGNGAPGCGAQQVNYEVDSARLAQGPGVGT
ncbi:hypothetical protein MMC15_002292 [Xylographa vitiligo]|nr:hypothetical protein [Xylographa vitiligo]